MDYACTNYHNWVMGTDVTRLGILIRSRRESKGYKAKEVAALAGVTREAVTAIERGRTKNPGPDVLRNIGKALEIPQAELLVAVGHLTEDEARPLIDVAEYRQILSQLDEGRRRLERLEATRGSRGGIPGGNAGPSSASGS